MRLLPDKKAGFLADKLIADYASSLFSGQTDAVMQKAATAMGIAISSPPFSLCLAFRRSGVYDDRSMEHVYRVHLRASGPPGDIFWRQRCAF